jgi:hypothetical protein
MDGLGTVIEVLGLLIDELEINFMVEEKRQTSLRVA